MSLLVLPACAQDPAGPFFHSWQLPDGSTWARFFRTEPGYLIRFPSLADFDVSADGRETICRPAPGTTKETIEHLYQNQVLPLALSRQGKLVFHGSAVEADGSAVAFLGRTGSGKSTLAASFTRSGDRFLTDDGLVLGGSRDNPTVQPAHPSLRLWTDSAARLFGESAELAPPVQYTSKVRILAGTSFEPCPHERPLVAMYVLSGEDADAASIRPIAGADALAALVGNAFLLDVDDRQMLTWHFNELSALANRNICFRLEYPRRYEALPEVRAAILAHASGV
jgi:hypothetical protein